MNHFWVAMANISSLLYPEKEYIQRNCDGCLMVLYFMYLFVSFIRIIFRLPWKQLLGSFVLAVH